MKKFFRSYFARVMVTAFLLAVQLIIILGSICLACGSFRYTLTARLAALLLSVTMSVCIASKNSPPPFKTGWIIGIMGLPAVFIPLYIFYGRGGYIKKLGILLKQKPSENPLPQGVGENVRKQFALLSHEGFGASDSSECEYLPTGEAIFEKIKSMLNCAKKYIFLEFFIIDKGFMWEEILKILRRKASEGVKVYILYDDIGTICLLPSDYCKQLEQAGINALIHNRFCAVVSPLINYRDHRKIIVCDGIAALTGGANIADEYINRISPYGYWKDNGVYIEGESAFSMAKMFVILWNLNGGELSSEDFRPHSFTQKRYNGFCTPFTDIPTRNPGISEKVFINMISCAEKSVYISTPYLVPTPQIVSALCMAAESGIDVRIITPLVPDKRYVHIMTRSNYRILLEHGVKIYEYTPGFIHAKSIISDGETAYIGSANFDYRSLYLHFENGVFMHRTKACYSLAEDFEELFGLSGRITLQSKAVRSACVSVLGKILKLFSGLL